MTRKRRIGDDVIKLNSLIARASSKLRFARAFVAFPGSIFFSALISKILADGSRQTSDGLYRIKSVSGDEITASSCADVAANAKYVKSKYKLEKKYRKKEKKEKGNVYVSVSDNIFIECASDVVWFDVDESGDIVIATSASLEMFGYAVDFVDIETSSIVNLEFSIDEYDYIKLNTSPDQSIAVGLSVSDAIRMSTDFDSDILLKINGSEDIIATDGSSMMVGRLISVGSDLFLYDSSASKQICSISNSDSIVISSDAVAYKTKIIDVSDVVIARTVPSAIRSIHIAESNRVLASTSGQSSTSGLPLSASAASDVSSATTASVSISGPNQVVTVSATEPDAAKIDETSGVFTITRDSTSGSLTVNYSMSGTATNGDDYDTVSGSVTIANGNSTATVNINPVQTSISDDWTVTAILTITSGTGYSIGSPSSDTVTIDCNLVENGTFEDGFTGWTYDGVGEEISNTGGNPGKFLKAINNNGRVSQYIPTYNYGHYLLEADLKYLGDYGIDGDQLVYFEAGRGTQGIDDWIPLTDANDHWDTHTITFSNRAYSYFHGYSGSSIIEIKFFYSLADAGVDNIRCRRIA